MARKRPIDEEIADFIEKWDSDQMNAFFRDIIPLLELYETMDGKDWIKDHVPEEEVDVIRLLRMVYLISRIASFHAGKLCAMKIEFKDLWQRMEKMSKFDS